MTYTPTEQTNLDAIRAMLAHEARQDWDAVYELVTEDCVTRMGALVLQGKAETRAYDAKYFIPVFASSARTILDIAADGDSVVFRWRADAVLRADGRSVSWEGVSWCRLKDGKVDDGHIYILATQDDLLGWMKMRHDRIQDGRNPAVPRRRP